MLTPLASQRRAVHIHRRQAQAHRTQLRQLTFRIAATQSGGQEEQGRLRVINGREQQCSERSCSPEVDGMPAVCWASCHTMHTHPPWHCTAHALLCSTKSSCWQVSTLGHAINRLHSLGGKKARAWQGQFAGMQGRSRHAAGHRCAVYHPAQPRPCSRAAKIQADTCVEPWTRG